MNIARTQYIDHDFTGRQTASRMFLSWVSVPKSFLVQLQIILQNGLVSVLSFVVILVSMVGYVAVINFIMLRGASLKQVQNEIKLIEGDVLRNEGVLANTSARASLEKHENIALMQNINHMYYISSHTSVADASEYQSIR